MDGERWTYIYSFSCGGFLDFKERWIQSCYCTSNFQQWMASNIAMWVLASSKINYGHTLLTEYATNIHPVLYLYFKEKKLHSRAEQSINSFHRQLARGSIPNGNRNHIFVLQQQTINYLDAMQK